MSRKAYLLFATLLCLFLCSCKSTQTVSAVTGPKRYLIFVPGLYGTGLWDPREDEKIWVTASEALWGKNSLALPIPGLIQNRALVHGPILDFVQVIPWVYKQSIYGDTLDALQDFATKENMIFVPFPYDWRKSYLSTVKKLNEKIQSLNLEADDEVYFVAHSMGAAITSYYLRYGAQNPQQAQENWEGFRQVKGAVLIAAPFRGAMSIFRNMNYGIRVATNTKALSAEAYSSFEVSFYLLPLNTHAKVRAPSGQLIPLSIQDPNLWQENSWGLNGLVEDSKKNLAQEYTQYWLSEGRAFSEKIQAPVHLPPPSVPLFYLYGTGHNTVEYGIWLKNQKGPKNILYYPEDIREKARELNPDLVVVDGDETVPTYSAEPLPWFARMPHKIQSSDLAHGSLVSSDKAQYWIQQFIRGILKPTEPSLWQNPK